MNGRPVGPQKSTALPARAPGMEMPAQTPDPPRFLICIPPITLPTFGGKGGCGVGVEPVGGGTVSGMNRLENGGNGGGGGGDGGGDGGRITGGSGFGFGPGAGLVKFWQQKCKLIRSFF